MSMLLKLTNFAMSSAASETNKAIGLAGTTKIRSTSTPPAVLQAKKQLTRAHKKLRALKPSLHARDLLRQAQKKYKHAVRVARVMAGARRDKQLFSIMTDNPYSLFSSIKSSKKSTARAIQKLA